MRKGVAKADIEGGLREVFGDDAAQQQFRSGVHSGEERVEGAPEDEQSELPISMVSLLNSEERCRAAMQSGVPSFSSRLTP